MKRMSYKSRAKEAGLSLIELLLVLTVVAGLLVLAFVTYPKVQASNRATLESTHATLITTGIKSMYATSRSFTSLTNAALINAKQVPDDMRVDAAGNINNVWDGSVIVTADPASALRYQIQYTGVPRAECVSLATSLAANFLKTTVNATVVMDRTGTGVASDAAAVAIACVDSNTNVLNFVGN